MRRPLLALLIVSLASLSGCLGAGEHNSPEAQADQLNKSDALIATGKRQIKEGDELIARAGAMDAAAAARLTDEGNALKRRGQANIDRGLAIRDQ